ncbi:MAG: hypothetical protein KGY45_01155 [Hadesarchaea archaeon]|nr:hypothetical protein [Hadesarchaea archaeon]
MDKSLCLKCKGGRMLCGRSKCPIQSRINSLKSIEQKISKKSLFGASPPSIFVGRQGYPEVRIGPMVSPIQGEEGRKFNDPKAWLGKDIEEVIDLRTELVRSNFNANVKSARKPDKFLDITQELAMASKPVDTEVELSKPPKIQLTYDGVLSPIGPTGNLKEAKLTENPKVDRPVEYLVSDHDARASVALEELYEKDVDVYQSSRLLSAGLLGNKKNRKLVPTRWSITAVDSQLGNNLLSQVKQYQQFSEIKLFSGEKLGNHFEILFIPDAYSFELIEMWRPNSVWTGKGSTQIVVDQEDWRSSSGYSPLGGGYYATRLPVLEHMNKVRRKASVLAIREISSDYWAPLGVWVVRETARKALSQDPKTFETVEEALSSMASRLKVPRKEWYSKSKLLKRRREQLRIEQFLEESK